MLTLGNGTKTMCVRPTKTKLLLLILPPTTNNDKLRHKIRFSILKSY